MAVAAGTDLLCFGRDQDRGDLSGGPGGDGRGGQVRPAARVQARGVGGTGRRAAPVGGRRPARWPATGPPRRWRGSGGGAGRPDRRSPGAAPGRDRRGRCPIPVLVEIVPPSNIAVGTVPWGLSGWVAADRVHRISTATGADPPAGALPPRRGPAALAAGRDIDRILRPPAGPADRGPRRAPVPGRPVRHPRPARGPARRGRGRDGTPGMASARTGVSRYIWCNTCEQPGRGGDTWPDFGPDTRGERPWARSSLTTSPRSIRAA